VGELRRGRSPGNRHRVGWTGCQRTVLVEVLAAHLPAYTKMVVKGNRGGLPVPLTLGPSCIARVTDVAPDVFYVAPGDIVLDTALLDAGGGDEILVGWVGLGGSGAGSERTDRRRTVWHDGVFAERALCAKETMGPAREEDRRRRRVRRIVAARFGCGVVLARPRGRRSASAPIHVTLPKAAPRCGRSRSARSARRGAGRRPCD